MLYYWATEDSWKLTALIKTRFMNKNVLQTARARISICAYGMRNDTNLMENFKLGEYIRKVIFRSQWDTN